MPSYFGGAGMNFVVDVFSFNTSFTGMANTLSVCTLSPSTVIFLSNRTAPGGGGWSKYKRCKEVYVMLILLKIMIFVLSKYYNI